MGCMRCNVVIRPRRQPDILFLVHTAVLKCREQTYTCTSRNAHRNLSQINMTKLSIHCQFLQMTLIISLMVLMRIFLCFPDAFEQCQMWNGESGMLKISMWHSYMQCSPKYALPRLVTLPKSKLVISLYWCCCRKRSNTWSSTSCTILWLLNLIFAYQLSRKPYACVAICSV